MLKEGEGARGGGAVPADGVAWRSASSTKSFPPT